ncbi:hypothetical protein CSUI_001055 [Cystoisospora suis]|uniref:Uncharacterized protein n=1 Tax=Cystoisospora suis TaxID=483139 RepID=A0A2C6LBR8_9APIC|nr:hypothetical protein CSUI_001055 [Cystoisospora suis]
MDSTLLLSPSGARASEPCQSFTRDAAQLSAPINVPAFSPVFAISRSSLPEQHVYSGVQPASLGCFPSSSPLSCSSTLTKPPLSSSSPAVGLQDASCAAGPSIASQGWKVSLTGHVGRGSSSSMPSCRQNTCGHDAEAVGESACSDARHNKPPLSYDGFGRPLNRPCNSGMYPGEERRDSSVPNDLSQDASSYSRQISSHSDATTRPSLSHCTLVPSPHENPIGYRNLEQFLSVCLQRYAHMSKSQERAACMCLFNAIHHAISRYNNVLKKWAFVRWHVSSVLAAGSPKRRRDHTPEFCNSRSLPLLPREKTGCSPPVSSHEESKGTAGTGECFSDHALLQFLRHHLSHTNGSGPSVVNSQPQNVQPSTKPSSHRQTSPLQRTEGDASQNRFAANTRVESSHPESETGRASACMSAGIRARVSGSWTGLPSVKGAVFLKNSSRVAQGEGPRDSTVKTVQKTVVSQHTSTTAGSAAGMARNSVSSQAHQEIVGGGRRGVQGVLAARPLSRGGKARVLPMNDGGRLSGRRTNIPAVWDRSLRSMDTTAGQVLPKKGQPQGKETHLFVASSGECTREAHATSDAGRQNHAVEKKARDCGSFPGPSKKQTTGGTGTVPNSLASGDRKYVSPCASKTSGQQGLDMPVQRRQHTRGENIFNLLEAVASALCTRSQERAAKTVSTDTLPAVRPSTTEVETFSDKGGGRGTAQGNTNTQGEASRHGARIEQLDETEGVGGVTQHHPEADKGIREIGAWPDEEESLASATIKLRTQTLSVMAASLLSRDYESFFTDLKGYTTSDMSSPPSAPPSCSIE